MLAIDRSLKHSRMSSSTKFFRGVPKPAVDFLSRNKRAVKKAPAPDNKTRPQQETRIKKNPTKQVQAQKNGKTKVAPESNTVTISKSYLESLLKSTKGEASSDPAIHTGVKHVHLDSSQVPGLENVPQPPVSQALPPQALYREARPAQGLYREPDTTNAVNQQSKPSHFPHNAPAPQPKLTAKEQWLKDLAEQVKEKKARERKEPKREQNSEVYFPFGKPGCGAPIRTETGEVMADLRPILRSSNEGPIQQLAVKEQVPEKEFFPYGRPGCGAPNASEGHGVSYQAYDGMNKQQALNYPIEQARQQYSNQYSGFQQPNPPSNTHYQQNIHQNQIPDQFPNQRQTDAPMHQYPVHQQQQGANSNTQYQPPEQGFKENPAQIASPREGFARGAGPYVDKYVQQDLDQRRRKEQDYRAELANQIAAQKREKEAKRLAKEREEAIEEARLAKEREKLRLQFQREVEERKRKEELAIQRHRLLQQGIEEANRAALLAKNKPHHAIPSNYSPEHSKPTTMGREQSSVNLSSKFDSVIRSPSMLQLKETPKPGKENSKRVSRIPVRSTPKRAPVKTRVERPIEYLPPGSPPIPTLARKMGYPKYEMGRNEPAPVNYVRSISPPVPTLAKKMSHDNVLVSHDREKSVTKLPAIEQIRSFSPPVPTLAKKASHDAFAKSHDQAQGSHDRANSPPVPTIAKKISKNFEQSAIPINRQPSCELSRDDLSSPVHIHIAASKSSNNMGPSRQQVILEQLAALKKGILSHQSTIDDRVSRIMTRKRPNF